MARYLLRRAGVFRDHHLVAIRRISFHRALSDSYSNVVQEGGRSRGNDVFDRHRVSRHGPSFVNYVGDRMNEVKDRKRGRPLQDQLVAVRRPIKGSILLYVRRVVVVNDRQETMFALHRRFPCFFQATRVRFQVRHRGVFPPWVKRVMPS